jgi:hypothetical protein
MSNLAAAALGVMVSGTVLIVGRHAGLSGGQVIGLVVAAGEIAGLISADAKTPG